MDFMVRLKLVPLSKSIQKRLGIVETKEGLMYDKSKLSDKKKYQPKSNPPENPVVRVKPEVKAKIKADKVDEFKGLY